MAQSQRNLSSGSFAYHLHKPLKNRFPYVNTERPTSAIYRSLNNSKQHFFQTWMSALRTRLGVANTAPTLWEVSSVAVTLVIHLAPIRKLA